MKGSIITFSALFAIVFSGFAYAQAPIAWQKSLGGSKGDFGRSVIVTSDGNLVVIGTTFSSDNNIVGNGGSDIWVVKLSISGEIIWQKTYSSPDNEEGVHVVERKDGSFVIAANVTVFTRDWWIFAIDPAGNFLWEKAFGGASSDLLSWIDLSKDGGLYCAGYSNSSGAIFSENKGMYDIWVMKLDTLGSILWKKTVGGSADDFASMVHTTPDGGCVVAGSTTSIDGDMQEQHGESDGLVFKFDALGNVEWKKIIGYASADRFNAIEVLADGSMAAVGSTNVSDPKGDSYIVQLTNTGTIQWERICGGSDADEVTAIYEAFSGGYQALSNSRSVIDSIPGHRGETDWLFTRIDLVNGAVRNTRWFGGSNHDYAGSSIVRLPQGGYVSAGSTLSNDKDVTVNNGDVDIWVVRYGNTGGGSGVNADKQFRQIVLTPNPATNEVTVISDLEGIYQLAVSTVAGDPVIREMLSSTSHTLNIANLATGPYVLTISNGDDILAWEKLIKE